MLIIYTKHAEEKLLEPESLSLQITTTKIEATVKHPNFQEDLTNNITRASGALDAHHSLVVVYKFEFGKIKVITFFPAQKGRYEAKVLRGR